MKRFVISGLVLASIALIACQGPWEDADDSSSDLDSAQMCQSPPAARSYVNFDNTKLESQRANESVDLNHARFKPFAVMATEYMRVLGNTPKSLTGAEQTFTDPPARWYEEPSHSGVSLSSAFSIALDGCGVMVASQADKSTAPAAATASAFCKDMMAKAYSEDPTADQLNVCVTLATTKLTTITDVRSRWAHVCASILSSSQFLTY